MDNKELISEINKLKKEKNAVILGHYYQIDDIQAVSDFIGDSLALAQVAQKCENDIIVFCGVHFMAETAKILNPTRKVILPEMKATCSLAECCGAEEFSKFKAEHPDHIVVSYVNCSADIKALSDLICTSGNAEKLINALPQDQKIIFAPDRNLGGYINQKTGRNMVLWDGCCTVHDAVRAEDVHQLKMQYPDAAVIAHPECRPSTLAEADFVGSTKAMLSFIASSGKQRFIVVTERGILYEMKKNFPDKTFIDVPGGAGKSCINCDYMKMNTLENLYACLRDESPEIILPMDLIRKAERPIVRMLDMSRELGLIK